MYVYIYIFIFSYTYKYLYPQTIPTHFSPFSRQLAACGNMASKAPRRAWRPSRVATGRG